MSLLWRATGCRCGDRRRSRRADWRRRGRWSKHGGVVETGSPGRVAQDLVVVFSLTEPMSITPVSAAVVPLKIGRPAGVDARVALCCKADLAARVDRAAASYGGALVSDLGEQAFPVSLVAAVGFLRSSRMRSKSLCPTRFRQAGFLLNHG